MNKPKLYSTLLLMMALTACSSDDAAVGGITVLAESGNKVDISGEWARPCTTDIVDKQNIYLFSGSTMKFVIDKYTSTDGTCTGTATRTYSVTYVNTDGTETLAVTVSGEKTVLGWEDAVSTVTAPNSQTGPALAATPTATTLVVTWAGSSTPGDLRLIFYVDDSDAANNNLVLYRGALLTNTTDTYDDYLRADRPFTKR